MNSTKKILWKSALAFMLLPCSIAFGHGSAPPTASGEQLAEMGEIFPGIEEFASTLSREARNQFNQRQTEVLSEIQDHLHAAKQMEANEAHGNNPEQARFQRWRAQEKLLALLEEDIPEVIHFDLSSATLGHDVHDSIHLGALRGVLVLRVKLGPAPPVFRTRKANIGRVGEPHPWTLDVRGNGTTYIVTPLRDIPSDLTHLILRFKADEEDEPRFWTGLTFETPRSGQFSLSIFKDDGEPTPALVRIVRKSDGNLWAPPNAIDTWPIMTSVRGFPETTYVQPYMHYFLNMSLRGQYWVVPDPFEMPLPAGEWQLYVLHGIEHEPVIIDFEIAEEQWTRKQIHLKRWVDMPSRGWYSGDDHIHAKLMHSRNAKDIMAFVRAADIRVANILEMGNAERTYYEQRGFGKAYRFEEDGYVLVPGQEDPRSDFGHVIGLNLKALARSLDHYLLNDWVADEIHRQGGLYGHTHVGEVGLGVHRDMTLLMPRGKSDFASIMQNILGTDLYYEFLNLGFKLTASAGSDTPYGGAVGITRLYAFLGKEVPFSADRWFDAVEAGHTFVTNGPMLDLKVNGHIPGETIILKEGQKLQVEAEAWGIKAMSAPASISLIRNGATISQRSSEGTSETRLRIETDIDPGTGCWIALTAKGLDGTEAHTTPVYVHREGFRHWNLELAEELIAKRMGTLLEIEEYVQGHKERFERGEVSDLEFLTILAVKQADQVMERVELARGLYDELLQQLVRERNADH